MLTKIAKSFRIGPETYAAVFKCSLCERNVVVSMCKRKQVSCGCIREWHGGSASPEYKAWLKMKARCNSPTNQRDAKNYRDRGITVCDRWNKSFTAFFEDMGVRPSDIHSIDRIDNNKGYSPENCRWGTPSEQAKNRRSVILITIGEETKCLSDWALSQNLPYMRVYKRYVIRKWDILRALEMK